MSRLKSDLSVSTELTLLLVSLADTRPGLQAEWSAGSDGQILDINYSFEIGNLVSKAAKDNEGEGRVIKRQIELQSLFSK